MVNFIKMSVSPYRLNKMVFAGFMDKVNGLCPVLTASEVKTFVNTFMSNYTDFVSANNVDIASKYTPLIRAVVETADSNWISLQNLVEGLVYSGDASVKEKAESVKAVTDRYGRVDLLSYYPKFASIDGALADIDSDTAKELGIDVFLSPLREAHDSYISLSQSRDDERKANANRKKLTRSALNKSFTQLVDFVELMAINGSDDCYAKFIDGVNAIDLFRYTPKTETEEPAVTGDTASADETSAETETGTVSC